MIIIHKDPTLRDVFYREQQESLYSPISFVLAHALTEIPFYTIGCLIFSFIVYEVEKLNPGWDHAGVFYCKS